MSRTVLFAGTTRDAGVSTLVSALCRRFADHDRAVAPFAAVATAPVGATVAPTVRTHALAARVDPEATFSPVLRDPEGVLSVEGTAVGSPEGFYDERWGRARAAAERAHTSLTERYDLLVAASTDPLSEGVADGPPLGSTELVRFADADVVLVADASDGGAFASLVGTLELLPDDLRERVRGCVLTRVREADADALASTVGTFEARTELPICGLLPDLGSDTVAEAARRVDTAVTLPFAP
ncbi:AAA family ATPase [Halomarina rubra]|uniref:AAA family ATPase n=1 Tax=Halomarina rubra TaxID=2071873 RepID=A0ABD6ASW9_9EURY|nr:AAA family ATPase [Halomarina rubra]